MTLHSNEENSEDFVWISSKNSASVELKAAANQDHRGDKSFINQAAKSWQKAVKKKNTGTRIQQLTAAWEQLPLKNSLDLKQTAGSFWSSFLSGPVSHLLIFQSH